MANKILLVGGGGHCKSVLDVLLENGEYDQIGIIDPETGLVPLVSDRVRYLGNDESLQDLFAKGWQKAFISLGSVGDPSQRIVLYQKLVDIGFATPSIVSRRASISSFAKIGKGVFVAKGAVINAGAIIGDCCIINTNCTVEHDCNIGSFVHVSPGAVLCGHVVVMANSHIGAGTVIKQGTTVGENTIVGAGSVVVKDCNPGSLYYGVPARLVKGL